MNKYVRHALVHNLGAAAPARPTPRPRFLRRLLRVGLVLLLVALVSGTGLAWWINALVNGSLPQLDGTIAVEGLTEPVQIERDALGVPTITARNRNDLAFATGFVHAQDRFFQMDLLRRHAAGELSELFGKGALDEDRRMRTHRFRALARRKVGMLGTSHREVLKAYARGVEEGRRSLARPPWEYLLLLREPRPWAEEDSFLILLEMFRVLQLDSVQRKATTGVLYEVLPEQIASFLSPDGTSWDAPLRGGPLLGPPFPGPEVLDLRRRPAAFDPLPPVPPPLKKAVGLHAGEGPFEVERARWGSNNWAVAGKHTTHGGAIVANDMHLWLMAPGLWYRAAFVWPARDGRRDNRMFGATLPGAPAMVVGSNTHLAWGFTNTEGDWADLIVLEPASPGDPELYRTPYGARRIEKVREVLKVRGGRDVEHVVESTIWGPIFDRDHCGRKRALRWVAHEAEAINLDLMGLETARTLEEALDVANRAGLPAQNFVVADAKGGIAWTVVGRLPRRVGLGPDKARFDGRRPLSWAEYGGPRWEGWYEPQDYPRIVNPPEGRLWTANNRAVDEPHLSRIGRGNYDVGARAMQIRDALRARPRVSEADMLAIQLDNRALFLSRWQTLLLQVLRPGEDAQREALRREVTFWGGRAAIDSVGYRVVRRFRHHVHERVLNALTAPCRRVAPGFHYVNLGPNVEDAVWELITRRPAHLVPPPYVSWDDLLSDSVEGVRKDVENTMAGWDFDGALRRYTWGRANYVKVHHPFSTASSSLANWLHLDMPGEPMPGDPSNMPRIQSPRDGASQRMAVSPGREEEGYFHVPAGQSGHPRSKHYRDGHAAWARGRGTPFLPGRAAYELELVPK